MIEITNTDEVDATELKRTAKQTIRDFVKSEQPGLKVAFSKNTMIRAAEDIYTANGQNCPVQIIERNGETYILNRNLITTQPINGTV